MAHITPEHQKHDLVFATPVGGPLTPNNLQRKSPFRQDLNIILDLADHWPTKRVRASDSDALTCRFNRCPLKRARLPVPPLPLSKQWALVDSNH